ncbi:U4/U6-U5 snRNP complex subunit lsm8 [Balamuthia mandrillaris]
MSLLESFVNRTVSVITNDARVLVGLLRGVDQYANIILENCQERVYTPEGVEQADLGLYIVRGDNMAVIGEVDHELDKKLDFSEIKAQPLLPIVH